MQTRVITEVPTDGTCQTRTVVRVEDVAESAAIFESAIADWARFCRDTFREAPLVDIHDQATYTTGFLPWVAKTREASVHEYLKHLRNRIERHNVETDQWHHGYWRMQEAHHGTEHYELFLAGLFALDPTDATTQRHFLDASEHLINASDAVPDWFDWEGGRFHSLHFGTDDVRLDAHAVYNLPDHFRCVNLCQVAAQMDSDARYRELPQRFLAPWAEAILEDAPLPIALGPDGVVRSPDAGLEEWFSRYAGMAIGDGDDLDRAENILASDGIGSLIRAAQDSGDTRFQDAAGRLLDILSPELGRPDAGALAWAMLAYDRAFAESRYANRIIEAARKHAAKRPSAWTLEISKPLGSRPSGVGQRSDAPRWIPVDAEGREGDSPDRPDPLLIAAGACLSSDEDLAAEALALATTQFQLARDLLPDGRHHGCAAPTVSSIARGHGRGNHAGVVTSVWAPIDREFSGVLA